MDGTIEHYVKQNLLYSESEGWVLSLLCGSWKGKEGHRAGAREGFVKPKEASTAEERARRGATGITEDRIDHILLCHV